MAMKSSMAVRSLVSVITSSESGGAVSPAPEWSAPGFSCTRRYGRWGYGGESVAMAVPLRVKRRKLHWRSCSRLETADSIHFPSVCAVSTRSTKIRCNISWHRSLSRILVCCPCCNTCPWNLISSYLIELAVSNTTVRTLSVFFNAFLKGAAGRSSVAFRIRCPQPPPGFGRGRANVWRGDAPRRWLGRLPAPGSTRLGHGAQFDHPRAHGRRRAPVLGHAEGYITSATGRPGGRPVRRSRAMERSAGLAVVALVVLAICFNMERFRYIRWCAGCPITCFGTSSLSGRPALELSSARALLIVGAPSSGTSQMAKELSLLGLQVGHEVSDPVGSLCRDGTVSYVHGALRYARFRSEAEREATVSKLCSRPRPNSFNAAMVDGGRFGNGIKCVVRGDPPWDECWAGECVRVARRELGCASQTGSATSSLQAGASSAPPRNCTTPFERVLVQVRHPIRWIESVVAAFCRGSDDAATADDTVMLDTLSTLFGEVSSQLSARAVVPGELVGGPGPASGGTSGRASLKAARLRARKVMRSVRRRPAAQSPEAAGECSRRAGWLYLAFYRRMLSVRPPLPVFRVEHTPPCEVLRLARILPRSTQSAVGTAAAGLSVALSSSLPPADVVARAAAACERLGALPRSQVAGHGEEHGRVNRRNGRHASNRQRLNLAAIERTDPTLARELVAMAGRLGYNLTESRGRPPLAA